MKKLLFGMLSVCIFLNCFKRTGELEIKSTPPGIKIYLDGDYSGYVTPHLFTNLYAGLHYVKLETTYCSWEDTITLKRKDRTTIEITFPELKWKFNIIGYSYNTTSPAVSADGIVYLGPGNTLYAINSTGNLIWQYNCSGYNYDITSPVIGDDGTIYIERDNRTYAINPDGSIKWYYTNINYYTSNSPPAIASDGTIYVLYDKLTAISNDGRLKWKFGNWDYSSYRTSSTISKDSTIYYVSGQNLYAVKITGTLANSSWPMFQHDAKHTGRIPPITP